MGERLAVLIDADNFSARWCDGLFNEIAKFGVATVKRAYADWTVPNVSRWREKLAPNAIAPVQQFSYAKGKNSTDTALIIDAMDLLHAGNLDGFCLVSSDSDFTALATRLREDGLTVYGFGESKTLESFSAACDWFIYAEVLESETSLSKNDERPDAPETMHEGTIDFVRPIGDQALRKLIKTAIGSSENDDGWAPLSRAGSYMRRVNQSFDSRAYGYPRLSKLLEDLPYVDLAWRSTGAEGEKHPFVRIAP